MTAASFLLRRRPVPLKGGVSAHTVDAPDFRRMTASDIAFRDPLSELTRKTRTQLLFVGAVAILVKVYALRLNKTPWLDLEVPAAAPELLEGFLSVVLAYLFAAFVLYAVLDLRRWRLAGELHLLHSSFDLVLKARNDVFDIVQHLEKMTSDVALREEIRAAVSRAAKSLPEALGNLESLRGGLRSLTWLQWVRLVVLELAVPLAVGGFALVKTWGSIVPFVRQVVK